MKVMKTLHVRLCEPAVLSAGLGFSASKHEEKKKENCFLMFKPIDLQPDERHLGIRLFSGLLSDASGNVICPSAQLIAGCSLQKPPQKVRAARCKAR